MFKYWSRLAVVAILLLAIVGCDESEPEEKLEEAAEQLHDAREARNEQQEQISEIHDELNDKQAEIREAEKELAQAREQLTEAQQRLQEARQRLDSRATDVALFRRIQSSLLNDEELTQAAVSVSVEDRVVTLNGTVTGDGELERAIEIASSAPGVARVKSEIDVRQEQTEAGDEPARSGETMTPREATPTIERERL